MKKRHKWTPEELDFLKQRRKMKRAKLAKKFNEAFNTNVTAAKIKEVCTRHGFTTDIKRPRFNLPPILIDYLKSEKDTPREELTKKVNAKFKTTFTKDQLNGICNRMGLLVRKRYKKINLTPQQKRYLKYRETLPRLTLTDLFNEKFQTNYTKDQIKGVCTRLKLKTGRTGAFEKGFKPWNTGLAGKGVCKPNAGTFQKGRLSEEDLLPVGSERWDKRNNTLLIKVKHPSKWIPKRKYIWEKHNGPVPPDRMVTHVDCNGLNCAIENLRLITRAMNIRLNSNGYNTAPAEYRETIWKRSELQTKIGELERSIEQ